MVPESIATDKTNAEDWSVDPAITAKLLNARNLEFPYLRFLSLALWILAILSGMLLVCYATVAVLADSSQKKTRPFY